MYLWLQVGREPGAGGEKAATEDALPMQMSSVREGSWLKGKWAGLSWRGEDRA